MSKAQKAIAKVTSKDAGSNFDTVTSSEEDYSAEIVTIPVGNACHR